MSNTRSTKQTRPTTTPDGSYLVPANDLARMYLIDVSADGACFIRRRGERMADKGILPYYSIDDEVDARVLMRFLCEPVRFLPPYGASGVIYRLNRSLFDPSADEELRVDSLDGVADAFREAYGRALAGRSPASRSR